MQTFILRTVDKSTGETYSSIKGPHFTIHYAGSDFYEQMLSEMPEKPKEKAPFLLVFDESWEFCYTDRWEYYIMTSEGKTFEKIR